MFYKFKTAPNYLNNPPRIIYNIVISKYYYFPTIKGHKHYTINIFLVFIPLILLDNRNK